MADDPSVGEKIAGLRKSLKITQDEFGDRIGVSRQAVFTVKLLLRNIKAKK